MKTNKNLSNPYPIRLSKSTMQKLKAEAEFLEIPLSVLIRQKLEGLVKRQRGAKTA
jgi:hypothetical protein